MERPKADIFSICVFNNILALFSIWGLFFFRSPTKMAIRITLLFSVGYDFEEFRCSSLTPFVFYYIMVSAGLILDGIFSFVLTPCI